MGPCGDGQAEAAEEAAILGMHAVLLASSHPEWCGAWRREQVWVGGSDGGPFDAAYVAPHHDRVPAAVHDLVRFLSRDDLPSLTQAAVAHAQFETIHPFPDGNGRVGRALIHALLRGKGLTRQVTVPVSAGLLTDTDGYFGALGADRDGDPAPLVRQVAEASFTGIGNGRRLVADLHETRAGWSSVVRARRGATAWRLADLLVGQPVVGSALVQRELHVPAMTANRAIDALVSGGVLTEVSGDRRGRRWAAVDVLAALDRFAARTGRRDRA